MIEAMGAVIVVVGVIVCCSLGTKWAPTSHTLSTVHPDDSE